jgi:uncharacterized protein (DUF927 family)
MNEEIDTNEVLDPTRHCTIEMYAQAKKLPAEFLRTLGLSTVPHPYDPSRKALAIPYYMPDGRLHRLRCRQLLHAKTGDKRDQRFLWDKQPEGIGTQLYGLQRVACVTGDGSALPLFLVEGESDVHTATYHGHRALGLPGASNFNPERDDTHLASERSIIAVIEPGQGGDGMVRRLSESRYRAKISVLRLALHKDLSDLHIADPEGFNEALTKACGSAVTLDSYLDEHPMLDMMIDLRDPAPPNGFRKDRFGNIEREVKDDSNEHGSGDTEFEWVRFCSPLTCLGMVRDDNSRGWGKLFLIRDSDGVWHEIVVKQELLAGKGDDLLRLLFDRGFTCSGSRATLLYLIDSWRTRARVRLVREFGWHGRAYVHPDGVIGNTGGERLVPDTTALIPLQIRACGEIGIWKSQIAAYGIGNSRLAFALCIPFAGPLLQPLGRPSAGFHLVGSSSIGKTALALATGSVCGGGPRGNITSWRTTGNGAELLVASHNDGCIVFDELGQVDAHAAAEIVYMIGNGKGKTRADRTMALRSSHEWHVIFLSTGEMTLEEKLVEAKLRPMAGQEVRFISINADAGKGMGAFETLHGHTDAAALADQLKLVSSQIYGVANIEFLRCLTKNLEGALHAVRATEAAFLEKFCPGSASGQVRRVYAHFALVAAAGELAASYGVLPWQPGEATAACARVAADWLRDRGGVEQAEALRGVANVRDFIERHEMDRFGNFERWTDRVTRLVGFVQRTEAGQTYHLTRTGFAEACGGINPKVVAAELRRLHLLNAGEADRDAKNVRMPALSGSKKATHKRLFVIAGKILDQDSHSPSGNIGNRGNSDEVQ